MRIALKIIISFLLSTKFLSSKVFILSNLKSNNMIGSDLDKLIVSKIYIFNLIIQERSFCTDCPEKNSSLKQMLHLNAYR